MFKNYKRILKKHMKESLTLRDLLGLAYVNIDNKPCSFVWEKGITPRVSLIQIDGFHKMYMHNAIYKEVNS